MQFPVVKKCGNVTHVFDSAGNIRLPQVYKPIIILMYHLPFRFLDKFQPQSVIKQSIIQKSELKCKNIPM